MVTGWTPASSGGRSRAALHVARVGTDGELIGAGAVRLGLGSAAAEPLRELLESTPQPERARRRLSVPPGAAVEVDFHGAPGGALRDAVLRRVHIGDTPHGAARA